MAEINLDIIKLFKENAEAVSTDIYILSSWTQLIQIIEDSLNISEIKNIAVLGLTDKINKQIIELSVKKNVDIIFSGIRNHRKIDIAVTNADYGIAETGSVVIQSENEDIRLAGMLSEEHIVILKESTIRKKATELSEQLKNGFNEKGKYTAFITGPSRTADIERVLTLGVHGPLRLKVIIIPDQNDS